MNECVPNHGLFLSENYIVQPVENVPVSIIDYDKIEMTQLIQSGQLANGTPVIQIADSSQNSKNKTLHPLELEIQRDLELKQQQESLSKNESPSVIQSVSATSQPVYQNKPINRQLESQTSVYSDITQVQNLSENKESVINENENFYPLNRQIVLEKRQFIIVSDNQMFVNLDLKDNQSKSSINNNNIIVNKNVNDGKNSKKFEIINKVESDSENEDIEIEPVCDYEPDPDNPSATVESGNEKEKPNKCYMCFKTFRQKKNMYAHIRKIHSTQPKIEGGILCPLCKMHALRQEHLRTHLETLHEIPIEKEEKLFNTMEEFLLWKESVERETLSLYVSKSSSKLLANNQQKTYYKCHRSGTYVALKKENRKKKLKVQGSNKIGATCPAAIEVTENINGINVIFWKTHVGHANDLSHLVLNKEEKAKVIEYIAAGYTWDKILDIFKTEGAKPATPPTKLTMISKQDLRNIKKINEIKSNTDLFSYRQKVIQGRKPVKEKMLKRASQSLIIEKADYLLNLLETTEIKAEFRPKVCLMIDNLISTVKRRAIKNIKRENIERKNGVSKKCDIQDIKEKE